MESDKMVQVKNNENNHLYKQQTKQRASIKWLVSKAYNNNTNNIPDLMKEPFYTDHRQQEHLKPAIVYSLANAELYCLALGNIYSDPNYHNLNHCTIIQFLIRKGVIPSDAQLTETALIQTTPLKINAHLIIIDGIMMLYAKESASPDKIVSAVYKFYVSEKNKTAINKVIALDFEQALLLWVNSTLKVKLTENQNPISIKDIKHWSDLCDGVALALLVSYYCPEHLNSEKVLINNNNVFNVSDCVHNFQLIFDFCRSLPSRIFYIAPKDIALSKDLLHCNLIAFLADLFNIFEIYPTGGRSNNNNGIIGGNEKTGVNQVNEHIDATPWQGQRNSKSDTTIKITQLIPEQQSAPQINSNTIIKKSHPSDQTIQLNNNDYKEQFVVHSREGLYLARSAEKSAFEQTLRMGNNKSSAAPLVVQAAGKSSHSDTNTYSISGGRRNRRNSVADDSQLTIENFGGSQDSLYAVSNHNFDNNKDYSSQMIRNNHHGDDNSFKTTNAQFFENHFENSNNEEFRMNSMFTSSQQPPFLLQQQPQQPLSYAIPPEQLSHRLPPKSQPPLRAPLPTPSQLFQQQLTSQIMQHPQQQLIIHPQQEVIFDSPLHQRDIHEPQPTQIYQPVQQPHPPSPQVIYHQIQYSPQQSPQLIHRSSPQQQVSWQPPQPLTVSAQSPLPPTLPQSPPPPILATSPPKSLPQPTPRTITWQHQQYKQMPENSNLSDAGNTARTEGGSAIGTEMLNIRLKLEEKRRQIENDKRRAEANLNHQRQKLGKAIFFQTVSKDNNNMAISPMKVPVGGGVDSFGASKNEIIKPIPPARSSNVHRTFSNEFNGHIYTDKSTSASIQKNDSSSDTNNIGEPKFQSSIEPESEFETNSRNKLHSPILSPSVDDMAPQCISFIGNEEEQQNQLSESLNKMHITSGNKTYRIPSPTRHHAPITRNSFGQKNADSPSEKGFYISFDDDDGTPQQQVKPKPPLREKKLKKELAAMNQAQSTSQGKLLNNNTISRGTGRQPDHVPVVHNIVRVEARSSPSPQNFSNVTCGGSPASADGVGALDNSTTTDYEMERKKERILMLSLQRRQQQEEMRVKKNYELQKKQEEEKMKEELKARKREEEKQRRAAILQQHRLKKAIEEAEKQGQVVDKDLLNSVRYNSSSNHGPARLRDKSQPTRPRPKTIHISNRAGTGTKIDVPDSTGGGGYMLSARNRKGSTSNLSEISTGSMKRDYYRGSQDLDSFIDSSPSRIGRPKFGGSGLYQNHPRKSNSLVNLCGLNGGGNDQDSFSYKYRDLDSGLGKATPQRGLSPSHPTSPSGPGSLPIKKRFDDAASESGGSEYSGPRLYKQPATKSNRGIILNAVEYCVFPGVVNREGKKRVLDEINRLDTKHFLILFRDTKFQFRALYSYFPETDEVIKLYGTGPKSVTDRMFDKFFKYNSGGKCFSQVHTKHLTVTIDAFTIHNTLWQGKKANLPNKRNMALVI